MTQINQLLFLMEWLVDLYKANKKCQKVIQILQFLCKILLKMYKKKSKKLFVSKNKLKGTQLLTIAKTLFLTVVNSWQ